MKRLFIAGLFLFFTCLYAYADTEVVGGGGGVSEGTDVGFKNMTATSLKLGAGTVSNPALTIGANSKLFEATPGVLNFVTNGSSSWEMLEAGIRGFTNGNAYLITKLVSSDTVPVHSFKGSGADDGLGGPPNVPTMIADATPVASFALHTTTFYKNGSGQVKIDDTGSISIEGSLIIPNGTVVYDNYSVVASDYTVFAHATISAKDIYLLDATTVEGMHIRFKKKDATSNHITIKAVGGQNIDGNGFKVLEQTNNAIMLYSDGSNWEVLQATSVAHYGEMHAHDNSTATTVSTSAIPHLIQGIFAEEDVSGFTFAAGSTGPIAVFAEYSTVVAGTTKVTDVDHGLSSGAILSISGTTSYNGVFEATVIDSANYYITDTYVADDATGNWYEGDKLVNTTGHSSKYKVDFHGYGTPETSNHTFEFHVYKDADVIPSMEAKRKFTSSSDVDSVGASALLTIADGEALTVSITNIGATGDFTMEHVNIVIHSF